MIVERKRMVNQTKLLRQTDALGDHIHADQSAGAESFCQHESRHPDRTQPCDENHVVPRDADLPQRLVARAKPHTTWAPSV
jgi:hypothetical protein